MPLLTRYDLTVIAVLVAISASPVIALRTRPINDPAVKEWSAFMDRYYPDGDKTDISIVNAYTAAQMLVRVLQQCGNDLTRANVMMQAASLRELELGMLLPGIVVNTAPNDFAPIKQMQMMRFSADHWQVFGPVITSAVRTAVRPRAE